MFQSTNEPEALDGPQQNPVGKFLLVAILAVACFIGWRYLGPKSALASAGFGDDWDQAVEQSRASGKPALVLFTADWCPACRQLEADGLADADVQRYIREKFTPVMVDLSNRGSPNDERARDCNVRYIPTLILYDASGRECARTGAMPGNMLLMWLESSGTAARLAPRR
jgi:thiol:disulfide interchange protein DsbD